MGLFSKKEPPKPTSTGLEYVHVEYSIDTHTLKNDLQAAYVEAKSKKFLSQEHAQNLLDTWSSKLPSKFTDAIKKKEDTIYFFNHDRDISDEAWILVARQFSKIMEISLGLKAEVDHKHQVCIKIATKDLEALMDQPEVERPLHQQGPYR